MNEFVFTGDEICSFGRYCTVSKVKYDKKEKRKNKDLRTLTVMWPD